MRELSVFIDESGDFGETRDVRDYYLVTFVFHDQDNDIKDNTIKLENSVKESGLDIEYIHAGPVIRKEGIFKEYSLDERRQLLYKMFNFVMKCPINFCTVAIKRKEANDRVQLSGKLGKAINAMLAEHMDYLKGYDKVIVYYDNGQRELGSILNAIFSIQLYNVEFRKAEPQKYRLLQAADFLCTIDLLQIKRDEKRLSKGEQQFFYKPNELKKTFIKGISKKRI
ncbi:DUF3800 domain-containing protein [Butyrivibrio sp. M55]|uniref:DUF3800 domain-containing protein n=1 Tax=Butyrivibrio sp. M55 TaxID=1855323 RepID=UPI0008E74304|nr:DUF3800 domain-containing protein [Butyrivibrio sp. M55]SFU43599.1 hypothetical protein SAMN05216540_102119 [Butyrivibrio sp. M55]